MAHQRLMVERVLVCAWKMPQHDDLIAITHDLAEQRARLGRPLLYLSVIAPDSLPVGTVRDEIAGFYQNVLESCDSMHVVIEGTEFQQSIKRSVIAGVLLVLSHARGRVFVENSLPGMLHASPAVVRPELSRAIHAATEQRLFDYARAAG